MILPSGLIARLEARFFQYALESTVPALGQDLPQKQIQNGFHFWSESLTITYSTLVDSDGASDDGACQLSAQFKSGSNQIGLSNDFIDLATIATPGRQRFTGVTGDPSLPLHIQGFPWPYLYEATGSIIADLRNAASYANAVKMVWTGFLIPTYKCRTAQEFYDAMAGYDPNFGVPGIQR